jgi:hypothetical protein
MMVYMLFIICNQVLQSELGIVALRGDDITEIGYRNNSFIWGPTDDLAKAFTVFTPNFMKTIPFGAFAGTPKYWPFFWIIPGVFVYFTLLPFLMVLPMQYQTIKKDVKKLLKNFRIKIV